MRVCVVGFFLLILVTAFMCVNAPNDEHLNDENTVRMADKVRADKEVLQHSWKRMHRLAKTAAPLDCSHPCPDSASSISCGDFGTRFSPILTAPSG